VYEHLAPTFQLTDSERDELLPSGSQRRWHNRANWACYDLYRAGLLKQIKKGVYEITEEGKALAAKKPPMIDREFLMQFEPFRQFMSERKARNLQPPVVSRTDLITEDETTPEERIESAFNDLRESLVADLRAKLADVNPFRFDQVVLDLLVAMGYGGSRREAAEVTQKSGDAGIDGVINEDRLGLDVIYVQAKRWKNNVGREEIQNFVGALAGKKASKGVFITTSAFNEIAREYAAGLHQKIILIDGRRLAELMIEHGIGVAEEHAYSVKKIDSDYFEEA
jgi:restriction system protein